MILVLSKKICIPLKLLNTEGHSEEHTRKISTISISLDTLSSNEELIKLKFTKYTIH